VVEIAETNLNEGQDNAVKQILQFLLSEATEFKLSGAAGTGKTFLMNYVANQLLTDYKNYCAVFGFTYKHWNVEFTATTNKAADVLCTSAGRAAGTIHSFLGLRVSVDYKSGKEILQTTQNTVNRSGALIFIDEASMIDSTLRRYIKEFLTPGCKIIYVGDHYQLPPVNDKESPVYGDESINMAVLTQPMRNSSQPALMALCQQFRSTVETGIFFPIKTVPQVIEALDNLSAQKLIDQIFTQENPSCKILCYTNERVKAYNNYIRELNNLPATFVEGEKLILNSPFEVTSSILLPAELDIVVGKTSAHSYYKTPHGHFLYYTAEMISGTYRAYTKAAVNPEDLKKYMDKLKAQKAWREFYQIKNEFADLRPTYACTVHKSQGSTYDSVIIDLDDIGTCWDKTTVARLLYVAISRARSKVYLRGSLPYSYGGPPK
jgi:hypothetical protein